MTVALVTGGCGHLGASVSTRLVSHGVDVVSVHRDVSSCLPRPGMTCVAGDFKDTDSINGLLDNTDFLIHLASQSVPRTSVDLGVTGILTEVDANSRLFDSAVARGVRSIVFASSGGSVYGECEYGVPIDEEHPLRPLSPHGLLKAMTEMVLAHVSRVAQVRAVSLRPGNIFGPGQRRQRKFGIVPTFLSNLRDGVTSEIWGPEAVRDYVFVDDAADAFVNAALSAAGPLPPAIHVSTGKGYTALEVYSLLQEATGIRMPINVKPRPASDPAWSVLEPHRMESYLDVRPRTSLEDGIARILASESSSSSV